VGYDIEKAARNTIKKSPSPMGDCRRKKKTACKVYESNTDHTYIL
jgi:hypothetical protein